MIKNERRLFGIRGLALVAASLWLSACSLDTPPERSALLKDALPARTTAAQHWQAGGDAMAVGDNWLASFADPQLEKIVAQALANNPDLRQSANLVLAVAQSVDIAGAQLLAQIGGKLGETRTKDFEHNDIHHGSSRTLSLSWELDIWGRLRAQKGAAQASYSAATLDYAYARQSLVATTAKSWFSAIQTSHLLDLAEQSRLIHSQLLRLSQIRQRSGKVSQFDVVQAQAALDEAQAALLAAQNSFATARRNLELLLGRYPAAEIAVASQTTHVPAELTTATPLSLLARRPDLLAAEQQVLSAFRLSEASRLALLPDLSFQFEVGRFSNDVVSLLKLNPWIAHSELGMQIPLYEGGALLAQIRIASAEEQAAIAAYGSQALNAFNQVETALDNEHNLKQRLGYAQLSARSLEQAVQLANDRYLAGASDMQSVLQLQSSALASQGEVINLRQTLLSNRVSLNLALGSSFDNEPVITAGLSATLKPAQ